MFQERLKTLRSLQARRLLKDTKRQKRHWAIRNKASMACHLINKLASRHGTSTGPCFWIDVARIRLTLALVRLCIPIALCECVCRTPFAASIFWVRRIAIRDARLDHTLRVHNRKSDQGESYEGSHVYHAKKECRVQKR